MENEWLERKYRRDVIDSELSKVRRIKISF